jgi:predicted transcriptional regulator
MMSTKKRKQAILSALIELGGEATTREIAEKTGLNTNGVAQTMGVMLEVYRIDDEGGTGGLAKWRMTAK